MKTTKELLKEVSILNRVAKRTSDNLFKFTCDNEDISRDEKNRINRIRDVINNFIDEIEPYRL